MSYFANNPIIVSVTAGTFPGDSDNPSTNRRIVLTVTITNSNGESHDYEFYHSAESGETYTIDISSAYRAELSRFSAPTPSNPSTQVVNGALTAKGQCVYDGEVAEISCECSGGNVTARPGGYSDVERMNFTAPTEAPSVLTTKPSTLAEVVKVGSTVQLGSSKVTAVAGIQDAAASGRKCYGEHNNYRHTMYFLNRYGEIESASIVTQESLMLKVTSTTIQQVRAPQHTSYARQRNYHTSTGNQWKMSSGYVEREWLQWFVHDFLMSDYHWLETQQGIIPVMVSSDESITLYDKTSADLKAVNFTVESALEGTIELITNY